MPELPGDEIAEACRLHQQALACRAAGRLGTAGPLAERALEVFERRCGPDHPDVVNLLLCLAGIRYAGGDLAAAERLARRAVAMMERVEDDGPDVPWLRVQALDVLAGILRERGKHREAEPLLRRALTLSESGPGASREPYGDLRSRTGGQASLFNL